MDARKDWKIWIQRASSALYRGEIVASGSRDLVGKIGYLVVFGAAFLVLATAVARERGIWGAIHPPFPVARSEWQVRVLDAPLDCGREAGGECPAWVGHPFWNNGVNLEEPAAKKALREGRAGEVWLGLRVNSAKLASVLGERANYFLLGWLKGSYTLWVDGDLLQRVSDEEYGPHAFAIPESLLHRDRELGLVIRLTPRPDAKNLVPFTAGMEEGFGDYRTAHAFSSYHQFTGSSKPLALFLVYFVLSVIFFLLWLASPKNREYLHLAAFSLTCSLPSLLYSDGFSFHLWPDLAMRLYLMIVFAKATTALNLGLTFSRSRASAVVGASFTLMLVGAALVAVCSIPTLSGLRKPLNQWLISLAYLGGSGSCFLQAWALALRRKDGFSFQFRHRKLLQFTGILGALAVFQWVQYGGFFSSIDADVAWDVPEVVLALFLGFIALIDYRTQYEMVEKTPVSPYHKRATLPDSVAGVLLMLDLKNSERIFRSSLGESDPFQMPSIISAIWTAVAEAGGVVIKAEGDEVIAFFDQEHCPNPVHSALCATDACQARLDQLSRQGTRYTPALAFRAGIAYGQIRPIWVGRGSDRLPSWTQTAGSMVFVECARLMEAEKELDHARHFAGSLALMSHELLQRFELREAELAGRVLLRAERVVGKHDRIYSVTAYCPAEIRETRLRSA